MDREQSWQIVDRQRVAVADLLASLTPEELATRSWCDAWTVKDVGAHLCLAATADAREILVGVLRSRGNFDVMMRDTSLTRSAARTPEQIVADLRGSVGSRRLAPMTTWRDPLLDVLVHSQDMARPLGRTLPMPVDGAREAADWAWTRRFPFGAARRFAGVRMVATDTDWQRGEGVELRGPIGSLLLLSTGRMAALAEVSGPGLELAAARR